MSQRKNQDETFPFAGKSGEETAMLPGAQALTVRLARLVSPKLYFLPLPTKLSQVPGKPRSFGETSNRSDARDKGDAHKVRSGSNTS